MDKVDTAAIPKKLPTGISCIDELTCGGVESGIITEIYGEGGAGKTNLCMQYALSALKSGLSVLYMDSEGISIERLGQVSGGNTEELRNLVVYRITSLEDQDLSIIRLPKLIEKMENPGLVIIDSFTEYFRLEKSNDFQGRTSMMQKQLGALNSLCSRTGIPVLITNQIYQDIESGNLQPFGGFIIDHVMKAIYRIERIPGGKRRLSVIKHRSIKEDVGVPFRLTDFGISCEQ